MPDINSHILQAEKNLKLIEYLLSIDNYWDWKVTISFYSALHIVNAHLAKIADLHYQKHPETQKAIDPAFKMPTKVDQDTYIAYRTLRNLSNRARYLSHENRSIGDKGSAYYTGEKHYAKALRHLNTLLGYFDSLYSDFKFTPIRVKCSELKNQSELKYLTLVF